MVYKGLSFQFGKLTDVNVDFPGEVFCRTKSKIQLRVIMLSAKAELC